MTSPYEDIIELPHHVSSKRQRMPLLDRAAQFSPFAALTGYEDSIQEMERKTEKRVELDVDGIAMLNDKLRTLSRMYQPEVTVTWFIPDSRKSGGAYVRTAGRVGRIDCPGQRIMMTDGTIIPFDRIYDIDAETAQT